MTREVGSVRYGEHLIEFVVVRRERSTLEIAVEPDATVVVAAPANAAPEAIAAKVRKRGAWVRRQQRYFDQFMPRTPDRRYLSGETHLYLGRQYRLRVVHDVRHQVRLLRGFIVVRSRRPNRPDVTRELVDQWYRGRAQAKFAERLEINLGRFPDPDAFRPRGLIVRQLRQRWGSMSPSSRLVLNRRLIEASVDAIDYVITHELCHIAEPHHGPKFLALLDQVMPDWLKRKDRLERKMA